MQLDPDLSFASQIRGLKGQDFEHIVSSCYLYLGYHIERNVHYGIEKERIGELDIVGLKITPLNEIQIIVECKGKHPSPKDLKKFSAYKKLMSNEYSVVDLIAYGSDSMNNFHYKFAKNLDIRLIKKSDLSKKVLPIVWESGELVKSRIVELNKYLVIFEAIDRHLKIISSAKDEVRSELNSYKKYLDTDLWSISDPIEQLEDSFKNTKERFDNFSRTIAFERGKNISVEVRRPTDKYIQLAIYFELKHRLLNILAICRSTITARTESGRSAITERTPMIRSALNLLCDYNVSPNKFLIFIYRWIFLWGGALKKENGTYNSELKILCDEVGISLQNGEDFIKILKIIYGSGSSLFIETKGILFFKYVPATFRALGLKYREILGYDYKRLFADDSYNKEMFQQIMGASVDDYNFQFEV